MTESPSPIADAVATPAATTPRSAPLGLGSLLASARADFDCDGLPDLLEFFNAPRPGTYVSLEAGKLARLTRSSGAILELAFDGMPFDDPGRNPLIGLADVNGDGCDDAIVNVGHGASTTFAAFLVFDGTSLAEVAENGSPAIFIYEGSVRHGSGIECRSTKGAPELVSRAVSDYTSDFQWDVVERVYRWPTASTLALYSTASSVIEVANAYEQPADFARYWGLTCGSVRTPGWAFTR
ncbi:MAG TPA: hypothetical protein VNB51_00755 [Candidatus Udaeobacter sp.]|nr:hypothetical protein [Candidatus Udaeobacter sp.]